MRWSSTAWGIPHSVGFVSTRAAEYSVKSAQVPHPCRQALIKTIWRGSDRVAGSLPKDHCQVREGARQTDGSMAVSEGRGDGHAGLHRG